MPHDVPDPADVPHVDDVDEDALVTLSYVRDDETLYRVLPNHEGHGRFDLVEVDAADETGDRDAAGG